MAPTSTPWFFCPYHPDGTVPAFAGCSSDRKPGPGMALAAAEALDLDLSGSWVVGDSDCDMGLARAIGARHSHQRASELPDGMLPCRTWPRPSTPSSPSCQSRARPAVNAARAGFPDHRYDAASAFAIDYADELARAWSTLESGRGRAAVLNAAYDRGATVFSCGNGGSASIANHFQCDHVKGVRTGTGLLTRVQSLSTNMEILSAIANDIGYEAVFALPAAVPGSAR